MNPFAFLTNLFSRKTDPLDELLIEKGIDPDQLMEDIYYQRQEEGDESGVNRALGRHEMQREKGRQAAKQAQTGIRRF